MSVQTNFRAEDMLGGKKADVVVAPPAEVKKAPAAKKAAKVETVVEAPVEAPVAEAEVVEEAPAEAAE